MAFAQQEPGQHQRYELVSTLGRGGFAEVYLGWMNSVGGLRRKVAIKRILPELVKKQSKMFEEMFVDEARLAFQLEHENIVRVYDVGQSANTFFIVMEYVEGMDLKKVYEELRERGEMMPLADCLYIGMQVAAGLGYAHGMTDDEDQLLGLVHNDISPPNILIGRHGHVKVADFGLSDARSNSVVTPDGMVKGKFAYISPEGTRDPNLVSYKSDIFSVGVVLWEVIAGQRLFQKSTDIDTFQAVHNAIVPDLRQIRPDVPAGLVDVVNRALALDPRDRQDSCEQLYEELMQVAMNERLSATSYSLRRLINRLQGGDWKGFAGEGISDEAMQDLINELESILPPGVADHLKTFVTRAQVAEDEEELANRVDHVDDGWMDDVFAEAGLETGGAATFDDPTAAAAKAAEAEAKAAEAANAASRVPASPPTPSQRTPPPAAVTPSPVEASSPRMDRVSETSLITGGPKHVSAARLTQASMPAVAAAPPDAASRGATFLIWGALIGLLLGAVLGFLLGSNMS